MAELEEGGIELGCLQTLPVLGLGGHRRGEGAAGGSVSPDKGGEHKVKARLDRTRD